MPIAAKTLFILLVMKAILFAGLATLSSDEPIPYIIAAAVALAVLSLKSRRAWFYPLLVELLILAGSCWTVFDGLSHSSRSERAKIGAVLAIVAFTAIILLLSRSVRAWYRSRRQSPVPSTTPTP
jgi:hypothetical protein